MAKKKAVGHKELERLKHLGELCKDSRKPNPKARAELRQLMHSSTAVQEYMQGLKDVYEYFLPLRVEHFSHSDTSKEIILHKCNVLRDNLCYATASQLERLAIEQILLCWVNLYLIEDTYYKAISKGLTLNECLYWEKRLTFVYRRYTKALETLSKMRKMNLTVQINTTQNQIVNKS